MDRVTAACEYLLELRRTQHQVPALPADIVPSEKFVAEMRLRILQLEKPVAERRAA